MRHRRVHSGIPLSLLTALAACTVPEVPIGQAPEANIEPAAGAPLAAGNAPLAARASLEWPDSPDCQTLLTEIERLHITGELAAMSANAPIALLIDDGDLSLIGDMPLPITSQTQASVYDCLIVIGEARMAPSQPREILSDRKLRSSYPAGTKRVANPEFIEPAAGGRAAGESRADILRTGDPTLDLVGVLADTVLFGMDAVFAEEGMDRSVAGNDEPRFLEQPRLVPYGYRLTELEASRSARVPVTLIDQRRGERFETQLALREQQLFALTDDRHPEDALTQHDPSARLISSLQLRRWEASPPSLSIGTLIAHLQLPAAPAADPGYQPRKLFGASEAVQAPARLVPAAIEPAAGQPARRELALDQIEPAKPLIELAPEAALVRIPDGEQPAVAFFVSAEHLIAPDHALPTTALVPLLFPDGVTVYGLIERRDPRLGLALIFSPRQGEPIPIAARPAGERQGNGTLSGQPLLVDGHITGSWISDPIQGWRFVEADTLRGFAKTVPARTASR